MIFNGQPKEKHDCFADKVECNDCLCYLNKTSAQKVEVLCYGGSFFHYYCRTHRKPYNVKVVPPPGVDIPTRYEGIINMTEDGTPVGYKKIK